MTKAELIKALEDYDDDKVITLHLGSGWSNIEYAVETEGCIEIHAETNPVFEN